ENGETKMFDTKTVERISPHVWRCSVLSVARFSSGCKINGVSYILDHDTDELVRHDIWQQELKDKAKQKRVAAAEKKRWEAAAQSGLFDSASKE
ncbi:MAG: hypothetical protein AB7I29_12415, partial [Geobacter sp.]